MLCVCVMCVCVWGFAVAVRSAELYSLIVNASAPNKQNKQTTMCVQTWEERVRVQSSTRFSFSSSPFSL